MCRVPQSPARLTLCESTDQLVPLWGSPYRHTMHIRIRTILGWSTGTYLFWLSEELPVVVCSSTNKTLLSKPMILRPDQEIISPRTVGYPHQ
jgi:hypothetical protein